jgi:hypothetical protein
VVVNRTHCSKSVRRLRVLACAAFHLRGHELSEAHARRRRPAEHPERRPGLVIDRDSGHARARVADRLARRQPDSALSRCLRSLALGSAPASHGCSVTVYAPWCRCVPGLCLVFWCVGCGTRCDRRLGGFGLCERVVSVGLFLEAWSIACWVLGLALFIFGLWSSSCPAAPGYDRHASCLRNARRPADRAALLGFVRCGRLALALRRARFQMPKWPPSSPPIRRAD